MAAVTEETIYEALKQVFDPELFINIVDLGLVYTVAIEPAGALANVEIGMTMTSPACPAGPELLGNARRAVAQLDGVGKVEVKMVMNPPWNPDRMSEEARDQMGMF